MWVEMMMRVVVLLEGYLFFQNDTPSFGMEGVLLSIQRFRGIFLKGHFYKTALSSRADKAGLSATKT